VPGVGRGIDKLGAFPITKTWMAGTRPAMTMIGSASDDDVAGDPS
jgi:hypothetical protein